MELNNTRRLFNARSKKFRITVEPVGYLFVTAIIVQHLVTQNLFLTKVCTVNYNMNANVCDTSHSRTGEGDNRNSSLINRLQGYVSLLNIYAALIENIPSIFIVLFLGPWSDQHGRKPLFVIPIVGHMLSTVIYMIVYFVERAPAEYVLFANVPGGVMGGLITITMALNSYMVDITDMSMRTYRLAILAGMSIVAIPVAHFVSALIYTYGSYMGIWGAALGVQAVNLLYVVFVLVDSRGKQTDCVKEKNMIEPMKDPDSTLVQPLERPSVSCQSVMNNLWKCFVITFKKRKGYTRTCIVLLLLALCLNLFTGSQSGFSNLQYLYTRKKFLWDAPDFALFTAVVGIASVTGTLLIVPILSGYLKIGDGIIGMISMTGQIMANLVIAFAVSPLMMYLSSIGMLLLTAMMVVIRSQLSKLVESDEMSSVYAVAACLESFMPLIASPTFNLVYRATLEQFPGCVFLLDACIEMVLMGVFAFAIYLQRGNRQETATVARHSSQQSVKTVA